MNCVVFVVDECAAMEARVAEGTRGRAECVATVLNALLSQLATGPEVDVAVVGYRLGEDGSQEVGCRWGGALAGRRFVPAAELPAAPLTVEQRVRTIPGPGGCGILSQTTIPFPVWYVPSLKKAGSRSHAMAFVADLLLPRDSTGQPRDSTGQTPADLLQSAASQPASTPGEPALSPGEPVVVPVEPVGASVEPVGASVESVGTSVEPAISPQRYRHLDESRRLGNRPPKAPLVVHFLAERPGEESLRDQTEVLRRAFSPSDAPLLFHAHLAASTKTPPLLYPSSEVNLFPPSLRDLFAISSILPEPLWAALRSSGVSVQPGARGLIYNARLGDLIRFLDLVKVYAAWAPEARLSGAPARDPPERQTESREDEPDNRPEQDEACDTVHQGDCLREEVSPQVRPPA